MHFYDIILLVFVGIAAGMIAGGLGVGGGIILVPALVFIFGFSQHQAQGTSLAVLMFPVMAVGVLNYHKKGFVNFKFAFIIIAAFVIGTYFGSKYSVDLPARTLKRIFGILMLVAGLKMVFGK